MKITLIFAASSLSTPYVVMSKSKSWLVQNQDNLFEWSDMSTCGVTCLRVE
jgi:hypothetical protein